MNSLNKMYENFCGDGFQVMIMRHSVTSLNKDMFLFVAAVKQIRRLELAINKQFNILRRFKF
jgi:hypothetical protein